MGAESFLQLGNARYCPAQKELITTNGQTLKLRSQSLEVLHLLASQPGQVVSKDDIFKTVWKDVNVTDDSLVQCISDIRRQLKDCQHKILQTLPRRGYRLIVNRSAEILPFPPKAEQTSREALTPLDLPVDRPALAVMNFQNISADHTGDIIAMGLATDIHFNLAKMSQLFIIAKASVGQVQHLPPHQIGQCLGIKYLVQGTIQRLAKRVRVTVSLVEAQHNRVLWAEQYDQPLGDFFQLQDDITLAVVTELDHHIARQEIKKAFTTPPESLTAWELYHQGLWYCTQTNQAGVEKATQLLQQALALAPDFALAYAALSSTCINRIFLCAEAGIDNYANQALDYAYQCLEHDERSGWGYWALGRALYMKKQHTPALDALELSIRYKPNFSWSYYTKAIVGGHSLDSDEVLPSVNQALRLSPLDPNRFAFLCAKALAFIRLEDYKEAAIWGVQAAHEPKAYHMTYVVAAVTLKLAGQSTAAEEHMARVFKLMPGFCLQNYRNSLPHADETAPERVLMLNALKDLGLQGHLI